MEYALIASLIAVVAIAGMKLIGNTINNKMYTISDSLDDASEKGGVLEFDSYAS
ncbi:MAG: Flp family type IVb pilin [Holosporaceae bacterium]|nr:Flp family type IVb pilin [Holosporaceae bacterium]